jgi:hypothetical protein
MAGVLQHLRSSTLDKRPNPASMVDGQVAINYASGAPGMFFKDSNGSLVKVGPVHVGSGAPNASPASGGTAGNSLGEQWLDTSGGTYVFKVWDGSAWRSEAGEFVNVTGDTMTGALGIIAGSASTPGLFFSGDANSGLYSPGADQVAISTNGTGRLFVDASGRVIVGASSAAVGNPLEVVATSNGNAIAVRGRSSDNSGNITFHPNASSTEYARIQAESDSSFRFGTVSAGSERMRLDSSGRLGLGTSSPQAFLDIADASNQPSLRLSTGTASNFLRISRSSSTGHYTFASEENGSSIIFATDPDGTGAQDRVTIDRYGKVGIGTTSPAFGVGDGLEVARSGVSTIRVSSNTQGVELRSDAGTGTLETRGAFPLLFGIQGTERARIDSSGRLLVGTSTSPTVGDAQYGLLRTQGNTSTSSGFGLLSIARGLAPASITSGAEIGYIHFTANDGSPFARIECSADANAGVNDYPGRLVFSTTADGASSPTERVRISQNGVVTVKNGAVAEIGTLADGATVTPDFAANCNFTLTISGNRTLANPTNITAGQTGSIFIIQGTGSNALSWGSYWDFTGGTAPTLSTASGAVDRVDYVVRTSTSIHTVFTANYS